MLQNARMRLLRSTAIQRVFFVKDLRCYNPTLYLLPSLSTCNPIVRRPWSYASLEPFLFSLPSVRQATTTCSDEASPSELVDDLKRTDDLAQWIALTLQQKPWCAFTETELQDFLPLSTSLLQAVLHQDIAIVPALSFLSWACKQPGFVLDVDEVNGIAQLWASKYASFALANVKEILDVSGSSYTEAVWAALMTMCLLLRKPDEVVRIFMELEKHGCKISQLSCDPLLHALVRCQQIDAALLIIKEMLTLRMIPGEKSLRAVFNASCRAGKSKDAYSLVLESARLDLGEFTECAYSRLITTGALRIVREAQHHVDLRMHTTMLTCLFAQGRANDAIREFEKMQRHGHTVGVGAFLVVIKNLCDSGDVDRALYFKKVLKEKGLQPDAQTYRALEGALCSESRYADDLLHLAMEMKSKGYSPSAELYRTLITHFCTLSKYDMARVWVKEMIDQGYKPTPYIRTKFPELFDVFGK